MKYLVIGAAAAAWLYMLHTVINSFINHITAQLLQAVAH